MCAAPLLPKPIPTPGRDPQALEAFREAGRIIARAREVGAAMVRPGATIREVTETVEREIYRMNADGTEQVRLSR